MTLKKTLALYCKGVAMGSCDLIPGASGGTVAFVTGVYEPLVDSIAKVSSSLPLLLKKGGIPLFWRAINGNFLLTLGLGIVTSVTILAHAITYLLSAHPQLVYAFFFGLVLASARLVSREITQWRAPLLLLVLLGAAATFSITVAQPIQSSGENYLAIFASGLIAICALLLPGLSGAFVLLLMGMYQPMLAALTSFALDRITVFIVGCALGLLSFSRLLRWLFQRYHQETVSVLLGFMLGSLNRVWPWQLAVAPAGSWWGKSTMPASYQAIMQVDAQTLGVIAVMLVAIGYILLLEKLASRPKSSLKS